MKLPFTSEEFLNVFAEYNRTVFPMQVVLFLLALAAIYVLFKKASWADMAITSILAFFWIWMGLVYHILFFSSINKAAYLFGTFFIVEGALFLWNGVYRKKLSFHFKWNVNGIAGAVLMVFALLLYPVLGYGLGHVYPTDPTFGLPCPTTIFTFGIFLLAKKKLPFTIFIIPFVWALIGFSAAFSLGIIQDVSLLISALTTLGLLLKERKNGTLKISNNYESNGSQ